MKTIYECSQSKGIKWFTAIFFLFVIGSVLLVVYTASQGTDPTVPILVTALLLVASISCFFICPLYIIADDEGIGIRTLFRTMRIPYENIDHIERVDEENPLFKFTSAIRLFGVGGVFGLLGWFSAKGVGTFLSFVTDTKKVFLIYRLKGMPIAISVSEPDEFMPYYMKGGR
jgi:hypothetical protein